MHLTTVICTHNRARLLEKTLRSIDAADRPATIQITILVVANACTDDTTRMLAQYQEKGASNGRLPLRWVEEHQCGKSHALNRAIALLSDSVVAFVDDDHRLDKGYFLGIQQALEQFPEDTMFCGRILPDWTGSEPSWVHDTGPYRIYPLPVPCFDLGDEPCQITVQTPIPGGGNLFMHSEVFSRIGVFSTDIGPKGHDLGGSEDTDFVLRVLANGERVQYVPYVRQYHYVDPCRLRLGYLLRKSYMRSYTIALVKGGATSGVPRYLWRKLFTYLFNAVFSPRWRRTRFFLVRTAAALGEIRAARRGPL